jgi:hypothetical protein
MRAFGTSLLGCALLYTATSYAAPPTLDAKAMVGVRAFFNELETDLQAAVANTEGGRQRLLKRARVPADLGREIDTLSTLAREAAGLKNVRINSVVLTATTWFGILPLKQIDYHLIVVPDRVRLLRTVLRDASQRPFGRVQSNRWRGEQADGFRAIAAQMTRAMTDGNCKTLPRIGAADHPFLLPKSAKSRRNTLEVFKRFRASIIRDCKALTALPHHTTTVRIGEVRGSMRTEGAYNVPLKVTFSYADDGALKLFRLRGTPPKSR